MTSSKPLDRMTIVITASRRATELASLVRNLGGSPYVVPTVGISATEDDDRAGSFIRSIIQDGADYAIFMTGPGVHALMGTAERLGLQDQFRAVLNAERTSVIARSGKPKEALRRFGVDVDQVPPREEATARGILRLLKQFPLGGKTFAILWHGSSSGLLREELKAAGAARVLECSTYVYSRNLDDSGARVLRSMGFNYVAPARGDVVRLVNEIIEGRPAIDAVTFTSPPAARNLFEIAEEQGLADGLRAALGTRVCVAAIGPSTREAIEEHGVTVQVMPTVPGMGAMVTSLAEHLLRTG